jgi:MFS family permease
VALASAVGTTIEWYDFFIYGTAAAVVFGPQFFPQVSELNRQLAAFGTFAIGFIARPLGGIVMGHLGDRLGRKFVLVWALMLMGLATLGIGLLPTYAQIGGWAPLLLTALRFAQGFALGGEWGGAVLLSVEHAPEGRRGLFGSVVALGLSAGIVLSNVVFIIVTSLLSQQQFASWGWRIPFITSVILVAVGVFVRLSVAESPIFADILRQGRARRMPVIDVLRTDARTVLLAAGSYVGISGLGYILLVYFVTYATRQLGVALPTTLLLIASATLVAAPSTMFFAHWSDRIGRRRIMQWGLGALVLWSLIYFPLADTGQVPLIGLSFFGMMFLQGAYLGPQPAVFSELFPPAIRYSGASLSLTLGTILGGALAPLIATRLYAVAGNSSLVTAYITTLSVISWLCSFGLRETYRNDLAAGDTKAGPKGPALRV